MSNERNLVACAHRVGEEARVSRLGHQGAVVWLTGLSAAGKSTLAMGLEQRLIEGGVVAYALDGDNVRHGLNADLGFSPEDREENIRRIGEVAALFADAGLVCITSFISPYRADRQRARAAVKCGRFYEVFVRADLATCEARDPKGLYRKARAGELREMTGIDAPYEEPDMPDYIVDTSRHTVDDAIAVLYAFVLGCIRRAN